MTLLLHSFFKNTFTATIAFADPLEQFEVFKLINIPQLGILTNMSLISICVVSIWTYLLNYHYAFMKEAYDFIISLTFGLVRSIVVENLPLERQQYFVPFYYLFGFIFLSNLVGMVPYSFTPTSSFVLTFFLALTHFVGINFIAVLNSRWEVASLFLPSGVPAAGAPFLIAIEFISYVARVFSLAIRLFANMMSGHALLKILSGFSWSLAKAGVVFLFVALIPWTTVTAIMFLELLVAFLQAYVFTVLIVVYTSDVLVAH